jgi:hypothetical protein
MSIDKHYHFSQLQQQQQISSSNNHTGNLIINLSPSSNNSASTNTTATNTSNTVALNDLTPLNGCSIKKHLEGFDLKNEIQLRFLSPNDINELKTLCSEWFPVEYVY